MSGRTCTICSHAKRAEIELSVANDVSNRRIATQYGLSEASVRRHMAEHIKQAAREQQAARDEAKTLDVLAQLREINATTLEILQESRAEKRNGMALFAIDRVIKQLELQAKLIGDLDERPQVNITVTQEWQGIRNTIVQALLPFPDARIAVASALVGLEVNRDHLN